MLSTLTSVLFNIIGQDNMPCSSSIDWDEHVTLPEFGSGEGIELAILEAESLCLAVGANFPLLESTH